LKLFWNGLIGTLLGTLKRVEARVKDIGTFWGRIVAYFTGSYVMDE